MDSTGFSDVSQISFFYFALLIFAWNDKNRCCSMTASHTNALDVLLNHQKSIHAYVSQVKLKPLRISNFNFFSEFFIWIVNLSPLLFRLLYAQAG